MSDKRVSEMTDGEIRAMAGATVDGYEPGGVYQDANGTPWRRTGDGRWIAFGHATVYPDNAPSRPLRKLGPRGQPVTGTETRTPEQMLREFHASKAIHAGLMPEQPTVDIPAWVQMLRISLLDEEVRELAEAVEKGDIVKIADAIADIAYVAVGTAVTYGIPFDAVFAEVHRSNMTKVNTPAEAKLVKGPGYEPPDIAGVLAARKKPGWECEEADACTMDPACPYYQRCGRQVEHEE